MDKSDIKRQVQPDRIISVSLCAFCAKELHPGERTLLTLWSRTRGDAVSFDVHVQCFRAALSDSTRHYFDNAGVVTY